MKKILLLSGIVLVISGCSINFIENNASDDTKPVLDSVNTSVNIDKQAVESKEIKSSNSLDLSGKNLKKVDMSVFSQTKLEELDLSDNDLSGALPSQINQLKNLRILKASNNQMTGVPAEIGQLSKLEFLDLANNQLTGLPNELGNLSSLKTLNLSGNNYSDFDLSKIKEQLPKDVNYILN